MPSEIGIKDMLGRSGRGREAREWPVLRKEKCEEEGASEARAVVRDKRGAECVPYGNATTAT